MVYGLSLKTLGFWVFISFLIVLSLIDYDTLILDHRLMKSGLVLGLAFQTAIAAGLTGTLSGTILGFLWAALAAVAGLWILDFFTWLGRAVLGPNAMGGGDAKLLAMIGAWLGFREMLLSMFLSALIGSVLGLGAIGLKKLKRGQPFPFGPFLALGAVLAMFYGNALWSGYWGFVKSLYGY